MTSWVSRVILITGVILLVGPTLLVLVLSVNADEFLRFPPRGLSLRWYGEIVADDVWTGALARSTLLATFSATLATAIGMAAAWAFVTGRSRSTALLRPLAISAIFLPPIVLAVGSFIAYSNLHLYGNPIALLLTHTVLGLPYPVILGSVAIARLDRRLELAARGLGASPVRTAIHVTIPRLVPTIAVSWLLAFLTSFDEVVITGFILPRGLGNTLPMQLFTQLQSALTPVIAAMSGILVVFAAVVAVIAGWRFVGERREPAARDR